MKNAILWMTLNLFLCAGTAGASSATARFKGTVTSTGANAVTISEIQVGDEVTGQFTFDTTAPDDRPSNPNSGLYAAGQLQLSVRGFNYSASESQISVSDDVVVFQGQPAVDGYEVVTPLGVVSGPSLSNLPPEQIDIVLADTDASVFSDDSLPLSVPLQEFEITSEVPFGTTGGRLIFRSNDSSSIGEVRFEITELTIEIDSTSTDAIVYPQLVVGGGYTVVLILTNSGDTPWQGMVEPLLNDGSLDFLKTPVALQPRETQKLTLSGGEDLSTPTGLVIRGASGSPTAALSVAYFFNFSQNGVLKDSTGVPMGEASTKFTFPVDESSKIDTGMAVRRLPSQTDSPITLTLYNNDGTIFRQVTSQSDFARFIAEVFHNDSGADVPTEFTGSLVAESADPFYLVVLRLEKTPDSLFQLTSIPSKAQ